VQLEMTRIDTPAKKPAAPKPRWLDGPWALPGPMPLSLGLWAGQKWCGWSAVADDLVGGSFDAVGVVPGTFDGSRAGAAPAFGYPVTQDLGVGVADGVGQALRGKWPPGQ
jgi:hypothetical protein